MNRITKILMAFALAVACSPLCPEPAPSPQPPPTVEVASPTTPDLLQAFGGEGGKPETVAQAGAGGAATELREPARFGAVPSPCSNQGWKASACVKSPTSSRYYIAVPDGKSFAEFLSQLPSPGPPIPAFCIVSGARSCGGYPYDVCNDGNTDYFYCGNTTKHDTEGYWK